MLRAALKPLNQYAKKVTITNSRPSSSLASIPGTTTSITTTTTTTTTRALSSLTHNSKGRIRRETEEEKGRRGKRIITTREGIAGGAAAVEVTRAAVGGGRAAGIGGGGGIRGRIQPIAPFSSSSSSIVRLFSQDRGEPAGITPAGATITADIMIFRQLFDRESCTYTYLLADPDTREAVLVDPVIELAERDATLVREMGLTLKYVMNTHMHADHITGTGLLKKLVPGCQSLISKVSGADADIHVGGGEVVKFGEQELEVRATPGHTNGCVTYVNHAGRFALTGDALLIRGCGRTDFQEGSPDTLYDSVHSQILSLPGHYSLYPAHDYKGLTVTSVKEEKLYNPRLTMNKDQFVELMNNLGLAYPKKIDVSLPANRVCGLYNLPDDLAEKLKSD